MRVQAFDDAEYERNRQGECKKRQKQANYEGVQGGDGG
jgi:hypothetical protein